MPYVTFSELVEKINSVSEHKVMIEHHAGGQHIGIRHSARLFPISVNESEFNFMQDVIIGNNLKSGFELSTGTGISTIGIGRAFSKTGGQLISMDSYYEESTQLLAKVDHPSYTLEEKEKIKKEAGGYMFIKNMVELEKLPVDLQVGWSPEDVITVLEGKTLDFVFLDCPKSDPEFERDITTIKPFINKEKFYIFIHDSHTFTDKSFELVKSLFGLEMKRINDFHTGTPYARSWRFPLALITTQNP